MTRHETIRSAFALRWVRRDGKFVWQPRASDGSLLHWHSSRRAALATRGYLTGARVWHRRGRCTAEGDSRCSPVSYHRRWLAAFKGWRQSRRTLRELAAADIDGVWHEPET